MDPPSPVSPLGSHQPSFVSLPGSLAWPAHATSSPENVEGEKQLCILSSPAPVCGRGCLAPERPLPPTVGSVTGASVQGSPTTLVCTTWLVAVLVVLRMVVKSECVCTFCHRRSGREGSVTWEASEPGEQGGSSLRQGRAVQACPQLTGVMPRLSALLCAAQPAPPGGDLLGFLGHIPSGQGGESGSKSPAWLPQVHGLVQSGRLPHAEASPGPPPSASSGGTTAHSLAHRTPDLPFPPGPG